MNSKISISQSQSHDLSYIRNGKCFLFAAVCQQNRKVGLLNLDNTDYSSSACREITNYCFHHVSSNSSKFSCI